MNKSWEERSALQKAELSGRLIQREPRRFLERHMYYIGLDVHRKTMSQTPPAKRMA
jgi:hypothetical protein